MSKSKIEIPAEQLEQYNRLIASRPEIERKGKTTPYTSLNGHMFSFLSKDGIMGLRLSETDRKAFMDQHEAEQMLQHGRVMKEYVQVPANVLADLEILLPYLSKSFEYVGELKPKPSKK